MDGKKERRFVSTSIVYSIAIIGVHVPVRLHRQRELPETKEKAWLMSSWYSVLCCWVIALQVLLVWLE